MSEFKMQIESPPDRTVRERNKSSRIAQAMRFVDQAKGEWCVVAEYEKVSGAAALAQDLKKAPEEKYEALVRTIQNGKGKVYRVYCRFVGDKSGA